MIASLFKKRRKRRLFHAALLEMQQQIFTGLVHEPAQVKAILQGAAPPAHWGAAVRRLLPQEPHLQEQLAALEMLTARRMASALLQSEDPRRQLNESLERARDRQKQASSDEGDATSGLHQTRSQVLQRAGSIADNRNRGRVLLRRIRAAYIRSGVCYALAGVTLLGETTSLASAFFATFTSPDLTQKVAVWSGSVAASLALGYFAERGVRPLFEAKRDVKVTFTWGSPMSITLILTLLLAMVVAWVRTISTGEGGASDVAQFLFGVLTVPFLALLAGGWAALGTRQLAPVAELRERVEALEEERSRLDASLDEMDIQEHDQGASAQRAAIERESASAAERAILGEKEALLLSMFETVVSQPQVRQLTAELAVEAAEIACAPTRRAADDPDDGHDGQGAQAIPPHASGSAATGHPTGSSDQVGPNRGGPHLRGLSSLLLAFTLLPALAGCSASVSSAFGGVAPRQGVSLLLDTTASVRGAAAFRAEAQEEQRRFLQTAAAGSQFEVWAISTHPGMPGLIYQFTMPRVLPRGRKRLTTTEEQKLRVALGGLPDPKNLPWSSVLEDGYRIAERLGSLPMDDRRLVVMSDLQQHSPTLYLSRIIREADPKPLIQSLTRSYPPLGYQPSQVSLVTLPGGSETGKTLTPAETARLKAFWEQLWTGWRAPRPVLTEPTHLAW